MRPGKQVKSLLGVFIVLASIGLGGFLIFYSPSEEKPPPPRPAEPKTELRVSLKATGPDGLALIRTIKCPQDQERCALLQTVSPEDLEVPKDKVCASVYGGPSVATVTGVLNGRSVNKTLAVTDACQIALWNRLAPALGLPLSEPAKKLVQ